MHKPFRNLKRLLVICALLILGVAIMTMHSVEWLIYKTASLYGRCYTTIFATSGPDNKDIFKC